MTNPSAQNKTENIFFKKKGTCNQISHHIILVLIIDSKKQDKLQIKMEKNNIADSLKVLIQMARNQHGFSLAGTSLISAC